MIPPGNLERFHKQQNKCVRLSIKVAEIFTDYIYLAILYNNESFQFCCGIMAWNIMSSSHYEKINKKKKTKTK